MEAMGSHTKMQRHGRLRDVAREDTFFREHGYTRAPTLVQCMATLRCPLECEHCLAAGDDAPDMPLRDVGELVEQVATLGVEEFLLTGGEPLARPDLPEVIDILRSNGVRWSLNTAVMPGRRARAAIEAWPPGFVAVSVDGPAELHDRFRGRAGSFDAAMESIAYFADIAPDGVAAGTTVTARNVGRLPGTFGIVLESGATSWGLHLLVPEGRARSRGDLFLSKGQLRGLLRFAASKRKHFAVEMADEIGWCGFWDPLVRGEPFFCGAGRAGCVVLPDGEVVPCTTLDRSTSAGNVVRRPLAEIWETGFAEQRSWTATGRCARCRYASACGGGCWLQRRHGTECFRDVWRVPRAVAAAGLAVSLGLGVAAGPADAADADPPGKPPVEISEIDTSKMPVLQRHIVMWYAAQFPRSRAPRREEIIEGVKKTLPDDPGAKYFLTFVKGERPEDIAGRAKQIRAALETEQRSLCLVNLAWRDVTEWCLDSRSPGERTEAERKTVRELVAALSTTSRSWRAQIVKHKLDPFLRRPRHYRHFLRTKAGPSVMQRVDWRRATKRGFIKDKYVKAFARAFPQGQAMTLTLQTPAKGNAFKLVRDGRPAPFDGTLRVFDLLIAPADGDEKARTITVPFSRGRPRTLTAVLPVGVELTYGDVLRLVHEQNRKTFDRFSPQELGSSTGPTSFHPSPLVLPELRRRIEKLSAEPDAKKTSEWYWLRWALTDLYLF
jgi:radical SAM protein with 4Fe4S-binding SPASM domain